MRHFLDIESLSSSDILALIERALAFKQQSPAPQYPQQSVAHLFYENSTRTRVSFELAAHALGLQIVTLDHHTSSERKGEHIEDTVRTLAAMGVKLVVIRHREDGLPRTIATACDGVIRVINAGDGQHAHPTQAMLDMMTIIEKKAKPESLKIAVVGNIKHSRVAHSFEAVCAQMGVGELRWVAPEPWQPPVVQYGRVVSTLREGLDDADVIMCLRVQHERLLPEEQLDMATYRRDYALTQASLSYAKPNAMVMHPGPIHRQIEIDSEVADGPQSCILLQVTNGVFMRMAILEVLLRGF